MAIDPKNKTLIQLGGVVVFMGAMAWAAVPLYSWFCAVTGFGGATVTGVEAPGATERTIKVRFDATTASGMPWEFKPEVHEVEIKLGAEGMAFYEAYNPTDRPVAGQASYNVAPFTAGGYFTKIDCFCFTEQVLQPGERVMMPVVFYVDPEFDEDPDTRQGNHITLSYTFYEIDLPEDTEQAALEPTLDATTSLN